MAEQSPSMSNSGEQNVEAVPHGASPREVCRCGGYRDPGRKIDVALMPEGIWRRDFVALVQEKQVIKLNA
jgi:hypothetical protein